ncbi:unnamed protein product [Brassica oleracea]
MLEKQEPESSSSSEEAQAVTPWVVSGNVDHEKVIEKFGCDRIDESLICVMNGKVTRRGENKVTRTLGSREFMRYYKQKPPPSSQKHIVNSLATRFVSCDKGSSVSLKLQTLCFQLPLTTQNA